MSEKTEIKSDEESHREVNESVGETIDSMTDLMNSFDKLGCSELTRENKIKFLKLQRKMLTLDIDKVPDEEKEKTNEDTKEQGVEFYELGDLVKKSLKKDEGVIVAKTSCSGLADERSMKIRLRKLISEKEVQDKQISESEESERSYIRRKKGAKKTARSKPNYEEDSDDLSVSDSPRKCKRQTKSNTMSAKALTTKDYLKIMAKRMDDRKVPECEKFDEVADHDLEEF